MKQVKPPVTNRQVRPARQQLQPYRPADLDKIPTEFRGPDDLWVGTNVHVMVMMVNERQLKGLPAPATWSDLMQPQWKNKFAITDPSKSGTAYMLVYGLYKQFGQPGLDKIAANAVVTASSGTTYKGVAAGEYAVGMTLEYAAQEYVAGGQKEIKLVYPTEGSYLRRKACSSSRAPRTWTRRKPFTTGS